MAEEQPKATTCPNCQKPALRSGNEITCESCDAVFVITKKQEVKVKEFGQLKDHEQRIQKLEGSASSNEPQPTGPVEPEEEPI